MGGLHCISELEITGCLWHHGQMIVGTMFDIMERFRGFGATTVLQLHRGHSSGRFDLRILEIKFSLPAVCTPSDLADVPPCY